MEKKKKRRKFLRRGTKKLLKLGKRSKKRQKWRRARGRHNKIRQKEKGFDREPGIGYRTPRKMRGMIGGLKPLLIRNINDLSKATDKNIIIISKKIGKRKRKEILERIEKKKLQLKNIKKEIKKHIKKDKEIKKEK